MPAPSRSEISRVLSHALRHAPEEYGLELETEGWAPVGDVIPALRLMGPEWAVDGKVLHPSLGFIGSGRHRRIRGWKVRSNPPQCCPARR
ncbi:RNA 2'-phosphotransferase [Arthrobacter sp. zg-Y820]|uniref:RNA 2'-phosphotransferase n=1 Tax=Arthrobacter sp. zg-Y820 TaxID=2894192 RepID=UPI003FA4739D